MARGYQYFEAIEKNAVLLGSLIVVMVALGGLAQITPLFVQAHSVAPAAGVKPYEALRLAGRDIYVREGCYLCHSKMRALRALGDPYSDGDIAAAANAVEGKSELDALVAYLQGLGVSP